MSDTVLRTHQGTYTRFTSTLPLQMVRVAIPGAVARFVVSGDDAGGLGIFASGTDCGLAGAAVTF